MSIPNDVKAAFRDRPIVWLATADDSGVPNVAPMLQYWWIEEGTLVIGDIFMKATRANIESNGEACIAVYDAGSNNAYKLTRHYFEICIF